MERLGIFGGTFDPPHIGHLILAAEAADQLSLSKVLWVLTPAPPHKHDQNITSLAARKEMVLAAIFGNPIFEFSTIEIDRPGPHYAVDTVRLLRQQYGSRFELIYLIGGDSLRNLFTWHEPRLFIKQLDNLGVMLRPGETILMDNLENNLPGISSKIQWIHAPLLDISSSRIRQLIHERKAFRYYLPREVLSVIEEKKLYI